MKKKLFLGLGILGIASAAYLASRIGHEAKPCQCFCAFKRELRDKEEKDAPFRATLTNSKGKTFDICLCAQRDLDHLLENPELIDNITDAMIQGANCCQHAP